MASAVLEDVCRRARTSCSVAVAPSAAVAALPLRLQSQFSVDNNISAAAFQRFRVLLGPKYGVASPLALRTDLRRAAVEEHNQASTNGQGAFLVSPSAALEALVFNLRRQGQFLERAIRGADGPELVASRVCEGQTPASIPPASFVKDVHICSGLDKGGLISSCNEVLSCANFTLQAAATPSFTAPSTARKMTMPHLPNWRTSTYRIYIPCGQVVCMWVSHVGQCVLFDAVKTPS